MASRLLQDLSEPTFGMALAFIGAVEAAELDALVYCTYRPEVEQAILFRQGRSLTQIKAKAEELEKKWKRLDLAHLLMSVGPQYEKRIVTWAGPGQSNHNYHSAFDAVPLRQGKPVWLAKSPRDRKLWLSIGAIGESVGLEWAGRWPLTQREFPHFQNPNADWRESILGVDDER